MNIKQNCSRCCQNNVIKLVEFSLLVKTWLNYRNHNYLWEHTKNVVCNRTCNNMLAYGIFFFLQQEKYFIILFVIHASFEEEDTKKLTFSCYFGNILEHHEVKLFCREDSFFFKFKMNVTFFRIWKRVKWRFSFLRVKRDLLLTSIYEIFSDVESFFTKKWDFFSNRFRGKSVKDEERRKLGFHFQMKRGKSMLKLRAEIFVIFHPWQKFYYPKVVFAKI